MFDHLKKLDISQAATWIPVPELGKGARLQCRFVGDANKDYFNARLDLARARPGSKSVAEMLDLDREDDREVFPRTVMLNWEKVLDQDGKEVLFSREHAKMLLRQLPDWIFDRVRRGPISKPDTFLDREPVQENREELSGN